MELKKEEADQGTWVKKIIEPRMEDLPFQVRESINMLRGNIQLSAYDVKLIAVTSAMPNEGKSSIAFRLAGSFASLGHRTLFLDCDIRKSVIAKRYGITEKPEGLTEFLCGKRQINEVVCSTPDASLDIIFCGASAPNPSELISGWRFEQLCQWAREEYDYIVMDTPPVNTVIDGTIAAKHCDGCVMVVVEGHTERGRAIRAKRQLEYAGVKLLGAVLNRSELRAARLRLRISSIRCGSTS